MKLTHAYLWCWTMMMSGSSFVAGMVLRGTDDAECLCLEPVERIQITSPGPEETVLDTGPNGTATGSFFVSGYAPPGTTAFRFTTTEEAFDFEKMDFFEQITAHRVSILHMDSCKVAWYVEIEARDDCDTPYRLEWNIFAGNGNNLSEGGKITVIPPKDDDVLVSPAFAFAPKIADRIVSYDVEEGTFVIKGDASDIRIGDGLLGDPSDLAPEGYLHIVVGVQQTRDEGTGQISQATVYTRQAGLDELFRQVDIDLEEPLGSENGTSTDDSDPGSDSDGDDDDLDDESNGGGIRLPIEGVTIQLAEPTAPPSDRRLDRRRRLPTINLGSVGTLNIEPYANFGTVFKLKIAWKRKDKKKANCKIIPLVPCVALFWAEASLTLGVDVQLLFDGDFEKSADLVKIPIAVVTLPVPKPLSPFYFELNLIPFYEVLLKGEMDLMYNPSVTAKLGYEYKPKKKGRGLYATVEANNFKLKDITGTVDVRAKLGVGLGVEAAVKAFGKKIVDFEIRPQLCLSADANSKECDIDWDLDLVTKGHLDVNIKIFKIQLVDINKKIDRKRDLKDGSIKLPPGLCTSITDIDSGGGPTGPPSMGGDSGGGHGGGCCCGCCGCCGQQALPPQNPPPPPPPRRTVIPAKPAPTATPTERFVPVP